MAHNNTASLKKFTSNDLVNFEKCRDRFGQFFCSRIDSKHLDLKLKVFKIDDSRDFGFAQNFTIGEADFKQFKQLRNQLVNATEKNGGEENLSPVLIPTRSNTWMNHSNWLRSLLTLWTEQTESFVRLCCGTAWTSQIVLISKSEYLQGRMRTKILKLLKSYINFKSLSIYFIKWFQYMISFLLINPFVMSHKK